MNPLSDAAYLIGLASLPDLGPARLRCLLAGRHPRWCWETLISGGALVDESLADELRGNSSELVTRWRRSARELDLSELWQRHQGVSVTHPERADWPRVLDDDPDGPLLLFSNGRPLPDSPRVAVVGTRRCTSTGRLVARRLGAELAAAGVAVVSGLALGIDAAAHEGTLSVDPGLAVAVVAGGLDRPSPRRNERLWRSIVEQGSMWSEQPVGTAPARWMFPARNRLIAAFADLVVVVESGERGGSMHTVTAAIERDRPVLAVPGSVTNPAAAGTNALLADGCAPARDTDDVLTALSLAVPERPHRAPVSESNEPDDPLDRTVLDAVGPEPSTVDAVALRCGLSLAELSMRLLRLRAAGHLHEEAGWWQRTPGRRAR